MSPYTFSDLKLRRADNFWCRFRGLMFLRTLEGNVGLLIPNCPSVHTFFVRFAVDVIYLDRKGRVVKLVTGLKPWRVSAGGRRARHVIELAAGGIESFGIGLGDTLQ